MTLSPGIRKFALTAHLVCSVGWIGAVVAYLALNAAALTSQDAPVVQAAWIAMELIGRNAIVPLALGALLTGLVMALGTPWGLFRHYWVVITLALTIFATIVLLQHLHLLPGASSLVAAARGNNGAGPAALGSSLIHAGGGHGLPGSRPPSWRGGDLIHAGGGLSVLLIIAGLNVYKPRGLTPYGWRKQQEARHRYHTQQPQHRQDMAALP